MKKGKLLLLPNLLGEGDVDDFFPKNLENRINEIDLLIAENEKEARKYLKRFTFVGREFRDIPIRVLNEHTSDQELHELIKLIDQKTVGLVSDAGLPVLADPGSSLIQLANQNNIEVIPIVGPSSIVFALMLSGFSGQSFTFHGYLPRKEPDLAAYVQKLIKSPQSHTHICIEAPYRNEKFLDFLIKSLPGSATLCVATDITLKTQEVTIKKVSAWKGSNANLHKRPSIFLFQIK